MGSKTEQRQVFPLNYPLSLFTPNPDGKRRKRNAEEECNLQNAVCVASNCTCQDGYTASVDLTKCESSGKYLCILTGFD